MMRGVFGAGLCLIMLSGCSGCSSGTTLKTVPVTGKVTYKGKAIERAIITFATEGSPRTAVGVTDSNGEFKLTTVNTNDGAVPGEHTITIEAMPDPTASPTIAMGSPEDYAKHMASQTGKKKSAQPPGAEQENTAFPSKYAEAASSGLKRTVVEGEENRFEFILED